MQLESNFYAWLTNESGLLVPGSFRSGHNVFTDAGRDWLRRLAIWDTIGDLTAIDDTPLDTRRLRWIGVGSGDLLEITSVDRIQSSLSVTTGPDIFLRALPAPTHPTDTSARYVVSFTGVSADFDHHGASVVISEAALFADVDAGAGTGLDPALSTHVPVAYKTFTPLTKAQAQTLTITWEFRL